jgi:hypothetical protein
MMAKRQELSLKERFEEKVYADPNSGCFLWGGAVYRKGYGKFCVEGKLRSAHRVAWKLYNGPIPDDLHVLHKCDNPVCVNPAHLFLGTNADNMRDKDEKGRTPKGEKHGSAKLTEDAVLDIRTRRMSQVAFARLYGVSPQAIHSIQHGKSWAHLSKAAA